MAVYPHPCMFLAGVLALRVWSHEAAARKAATGPQNSGTGTFVSSDRLAAGCNVLQPLQTSKHETDKIPQGYDILPEKSLQKIVLPNGDIP